MPVELLVHGVRRQVADDVSVGWGEGAEGVGEGVLAAGESDHRGAVGGEPVDEAAAEAVPTPGDECRQAAEVEQVGLGRVLRGERRGASRGAASSGLRGRGAP